MNKFFGMVCGVLGICLMVSMFSNYQQAGDKNASKLEVKLYESENRLLKDQLRETEHRLVTNRTYEEGLTDGLMRSNNIGYKDGYHSAMHQISEEKAMDAAKKEREKEKEMVKVSDTK